MNVEQRPEKLEWRLGMTRPIRLIFCQRDNENCLVGEILSIYTNLSGFTNDEYVKFWNLVFKIYNVWVMILERGIKSQDVPPWVFGRQFFKTISNFQIYLAFRQNFLFLEINLRLILFVESNSNFLNLYITSRLPFCNLWELPIL